LLNLVGFFVYELLLLLKAPVKRGGALEIILQSFALSLFFLLITAVPVLTVGNPLEGYVKATLYFIKSAASTYPEMYGAPAYPQKDLLLLEESSRVIAETANNLKMFAKEHETSASRRLHIYNESVRRYRGPLYELYLTSREDPKVKMVPVDTVFGEGYPFNQIVPLARQLERFDSSFGERYKQQTSNLR